jgi:hypothetical protein
MPRLYFTDIERLISQAWTGANGGPSPVTLSAPSHMIRMTHSSGKFVEVLLTVGDIEKSEADIMRDRIAPALDTLRKNVTA